MAEKIEVNLVLHHFKSFFFLFCRRPTRRKWFSGIITALSSRYLQRSLALYTYLYIVLKAWTFHFSALLKKDGKYPETGSGGVLSSHLTLTTSRTMSMLTLQNIQHVHSGNYTCQAPNAESDTTQLFVTQRKYFSNSKNTKRSLAVGFPFFQIYRFLPIL